MEFLSFEITNFKGIKSAVIDFKRNKGNIFTLIGLNESGKTTILEALNYLTDTTRHLSVVDEKTFSLLEKPLNLIPISEYSNFNGITSVSALVQISASDKKAILNYLRSEFEDDSIKLSADKLKIDRTTHFKNSQPIEEPSYNWDIIFTNTRENEEVKHKDANSEIWSKATDFIEKNLLPSILFFPTFLFDFPQKIYLEDNKKMSSQQRKVNDYYRNILENILKLTNHTDNLTELVLNRLKRGDTNQKDMADQLLIKMSATLTNIFFTRWNDIFKVRNSKRSIKDELKIEAVIEKCKESDSYNETTEETFYYLSIKRMENTNLYKISQRSLGFRWFLSFILFTEIPAAVNKDKKLIFLLDEPAANLHSSAQEQILKSFKYMAQRGHQIIYSTHSQYLIDPNLLENAYVCRNETFNYTTKALYSYDSTYANITIAPYRQFVNKSPNKTTYFQPVLDILEVRPSKIEDITNAVIMEGKTDFYIINYFKAIFFPDQYLAFSIVPGKGADKLDDIVRLYLAWGKKFLIVVDGDDEGKKVAKEYKVNYLLSDEEILTLTDINPSWIKIESLVSGVDKNKYNLIKKKQIDLFFQEALYTKKRLNLSEETSNNFKILLEFFKNKFSSYE